MRFLSLVYLSAAIGSSRTSLPTMITVLDSWLERVRGLCGEVFAAPTMSVMLFRMVALIGSDRRPRAIDSLLSLMKNFPRSRPIHPVEFEAPFPILDDHVELVEDVVRRVDAKRVWAVGASS